MTWDGRIHWRRVWWIAVWWSCFYCSFPARLFAQSHADVVAQAKASLQAEGADLSGSCGAFRITKRTAWLLRAEGAGLLHKPAGNHCEERATDIIVYPTGVHFDILIDGGGSNGPTWNRVADNVDPARWRAPLPDSGPTEPTEPTQPAQPVDLSPILLKIDTLAGRVEVLDSWHREMETQTYELLKRHDEEVGAIKKLFSSRITQLILTALGTWAVTVPAK